MARAVMLKLPLSAPRGEGFVLVDAHLARPELQVALDELLVEGLVAAGTGVWVVKTVLRATAVRAS